MSIQESTCGEAAFQSPYLNRMKTLLRGGLTINSPKRLEKSAVAPPDGLPRRSRSVIRRFDSLYPEVHLIVPPCMGRVNQGLAEDCKPGHRRTALHRITLHQVRPRQLAYHA